MLQGSFLLTMSERLTEDLFLKESKAQIGENPFGFIYEQGDVPNNGYTNRVGNLENHHPGGLITVSYNGSIAEAFYQPKEFVASDDVNIFYPKFELNPYIAIFLCTIIFNEKYRFTYGRKWYLELMEESFIWLPSIVINSESIPNWDFMENYIKRLPFSSNL